MTTDLNNPMRFSMHDRTETVSELLDANTPDDVTPRVTNIDICPSEGNVYVHWKTVESDTVLDISAADRYENVFIDDEMVAALDTESGEFAVYDPSTNSEDPEYTAWVESVEVDDE